MSRKQLSWLQKVDRHIKSFMVYVSLVKEPANWFAIQIEWLVPSTAQKMKFSIKDLFSKCDQIHSLIHSLDQINAYFVIFTEEILNKKTNFLSSADDGNIDLKRKSKVSKIHVLNLSLHFLKRFKCRFYK